MRVASSILFAGTMAILLTVRLAGTGGVSVASASGPEATSGSSDLRPPDPQKELRHLSKNLKLKKDQRLGVSSILEERAREIQLLLDMESLSPEYRDRLAAKVTEDSDSEIETLLRSNQKRKFNKELARDREGR